MVGIGRTGLKAGSLAFVAGVAYFSVRDAGCGYRLSKGMGKPDEISGFTSPYCQHVYRTDLLRENRVTGRRLTDHSVSCVILSVEKIS